MPRPKIYRPPSRWLCQALACGSLVGCVGGGAPDDPYALPGSTEEVVATGGSSSAPRLDAGAKESHFPLVDGATWTYHHTSLNDEDWDEVATMRASGDGFVLSDEEDAKGEQSQSTLMIDGSGVYRVQKRALVGGELALTTDYDPAFLRYDEAWTQAGASVTLDDAWTQRCVIASAASDCAPGAIETGVTTHIYTVLELAAKVTVPAGEFTTVKIRRNNPIELETKWFWFAVGVGKVREENQETGAVEELSAYEIP